MPAPPPKTCTVCGRQIEWRKKWARNWPQIEYCGDACRARKLSSVDRALEQAILDLLAERRSHATICPSEAAKRIAPDDWRNLMERSRMAARRLVNAGKIVITQRGVVVDPSRAKGPIRLKVAN